MVAMMRLGRNSGARPPNYADWFGCFQVAADHFARQGAAGPI